MHLLRMCNMRWLRLVGSIKLNVSFGKEPYTRDNILQKRPMILRSLLIVATPYPTQHVYVYVFIFLAGGSMSESVVALS